MDLLNRGTLDLSRVQHVVLDEADQMLAVGFEEERGDDFGRCAEEQANVFVQRDYAALGEEVATEILGGPGEH